MYGLINKAVKGLVQERFGLEAWNRICERACVDDDEFLSMEGYDDAVTYDLVGAASEELGLEAEKILEAFGQYWVEYTAVEGYGDLLDSAGDTLPDFLANLDQLHARVKLAFADLKPPRFAVTDEDEHGLVLHYYSDRPGLAPLVVGLVHGLGSRFGDTLQVESFRDDSGGVEHDAFRVRYLSRRDRAN